MNLQELLNAQIQYNASDLILKANSPPIMRVNGELNLLDLPPLTEVDIEAELIKILT